MPKNEPKCKTCIHFWVFHGDVDDLPLDDTKGTCTNPDSPDYYLKVRRLISEDHVCDLYEKI